MLLLIMVLWIAAVVSAAYFLLTIILPDLFTENLDSDYSDPLPIHGPASFQLYQENT